MASKLTNLNNDLTRLILSHLAQKDTLTAYTLLLNHRTDYELDVFERLFKLLFDICPLSYGEYLQLHPQLKTYLCNLYEMYYLQEN